MAMPRRTTRTGLLWPLLLLLIAAAATLGCDRGRADQVLETPSTAGPSPAQVASVPPAVPVDPSAREAAGRPEPPATAPASAAPPAGETPGTDPGAQQREAAERERQLARREAEIAERERAVARREAAAAEAARRAPDPEPQPAAGAALPDEPESETRAAEADPEEDWRAVRAAEGRAWADAASAPAPPPSVPVTLPVGTELEVEILDRLSSRGNVPGDGFRARVVRDVVVDDLVAVPAGSEVRGSVLEAKAAPEIGGRAAMALAFERLVLPSGETVAITASLAERGRSQTGKDAAAIGGGAAAGAILGRAVGDKHKKRGAVIGAILGAAVGSAVAAKRPGDEVEIEPGTVVLLRLDEWARVTVAARR